MAERRTGEVVQNHVFVAVPLVRAVDQVIGLGSSSSLRCVALTATAVVGSTHVAVGLCLVQEQPKSCGQGGACLSPLVVGLRGRPVEPCLLFPQHCSVCCGEVWVVVGAGVLVVSSALWKVQLEVGVPFQEVGESAAMEEPQVFGRASFAGRSAPQRCVLGWRKLCSLCSEQFRSPGWQGCCN